MHIHFIIHEAYEAPGAYLLWANAREYDVTFTHIYKGQLPLDQASNIDLLIVMGGPQSPYTLPTAKEEIHLIQQCIKANKAVVGACLGAQLIGEALGARYDHSPHKEIGVLPIELTNAGIKSDMIGHFGAILDVGHWHYDMPGLTDQCKILAKSKACPRQIIEYSPLVYGFQCHMEFTPEVMDLLIANSNEDDIQNPDADFSDMNDKLFTFCDKLIAAYAGNNK
ncbi:glutamine amidotransferase [Chitinophaga sancti]|uniref:glutamine amidotransferase-related protein n=1 Tax=Chitinophaga sancti TaxID=1004 RepID=UPI002A75611B|nr:glutamine amidotransferase [Chitinophaga sancti]WPQ60514.1 glutamine amidotransferase [Chitinophaga sancti]